MRAALVGAVLLTSGGLLMSVALAQTQPEAVSPNGLGWIQLLQDSELVTFEPGELRRQLSHAFLRPEQERVSEDDQTLVGILLFGVGVALVTGIL